MESSDLWNPVVGKPDWEDDQEEEEAKKSWTALERLAEKRAFEAREAQRAFDADIANAKWERFWKTGGR